MRVFLIVCTLCVVFVFNISAQQTDRFDDPFAQYQTGIELMDHEQYATAQAVFREIMAREDLTGGYEFVDLLAQTAYYDAECAVELNNANAARLLETFIEDNFNHPLANIAQFQLGRYYYNNRKYTNVVKSFEKVDHFNLETEQIIEMRFKLGYSYFYRKNFKEAKRHLKDIRNIPSEYYYPANYYYGYIAYYEKDYDEALTRFRNVIHSNMYQHIVPYYICQIYFAEKDYGKLTDYAEPLLGEPKIKYLTEINYLIGQAYFNGEEYEKAVIYLTEYIATAKKTSEQDIYQLAFANYKIGDYINAISFFKKFTIREDSLAQHATFTLADCYLKTDEKHHARNAFNEAANMDFDLSIKEIAHFNYAKLSYELGYHLEAVNSTEAFIRRYPNSIDRDEARELLTDIFLSTRNYKAALKLIESIDSHTPSIKKAYQKVAFYRGVEHFNEGDHKAAIVLFEKSLKNPIESNLEAASYFWKAEAFMEMHYYHTAIKSLNSLQRIMVTADNLPANITPASVQYNLGYCYLQKKQYQNALIYFKQATTILQKDPDEIENNEITRRVFGDAMLRAGDCYFITNDYPRAHLAYNRVIKGNFNSTDYATYQTAIIHGLERNFDIKIKVLENFIRNHSQSIYIDDALFELGSTYFLLDNKEDALSRLGTIIQQHPYSAYISKAILKTGLIYNNLNEYNKAIGFYKQVVINYPKTKEANEALLGLKDLYISISDADGYFEFIESVPGARVTVSLQDSVNYQAAEVLFVKGACTEAVEDFTSYLRDFPDGFFTMNARFYRAECLYKQERYISALIDYEYVASSPRDRFTEKSLLLAARINEYEVKDYAKAFKLYKQLLEVAEYKVNNLIARQHLMRLAYKLEQYKDVKIYSDMVIRFDLSSTKDVVEARLYIGRAAFKMQDLVKAMNAFKSISRGPLTESSAEAKFYIAHIHYLKQEYEESQKACYEIINQTPSYEYWVVKSFLLLADNDIARGEFFQARATLQSVVKNYQGDAQLMKEAEIKLQLIIEEEKRILEESLQIEQEHEFIIEDDTIYNDTLGILIDDFTMPAEEIDLIDVEEEE